MTEHAHSGVGPLGIPVTRWGSGTSWLPDAADHQGVMLVLGAWDLLLHGSVFLYYDRQGGIRGADQLASLNWVTAAAARPLAGGLLRLRVMGSAEPLTLPEPGYPQLLQVASVSRGQTVTDREHPEPPLIELAAAYERAVGSGLALSAYLAPVGEPALGPVTYQHRPSAAGDPLAPLGHSTQDFTHVTYGTATLGVSTRPLRLEGSVFNSAHPDPSAGFAYHVHLNSYSARLSWNPMETWSVSASAGHLAASSGSHAHGATTRISAAALHTARRSGGAAWSLALVWGADIPVTTRRPLHSLLLESSVDLGANAMFGRAEYVQRTAADLGLIGSVPPVVDVGEVSLGCSRFLSRRGPLESSIGVQGTVDVLAADLAPFYGSRHPLGLLVFLSVRPRR